MNGHTAFMPDQGGTPMTPEDFKRQFERMSAKGLAAVLEELQNELTERGLTDLAASVGLTSGMLLRVILAEARRAGGAA